MQLSTLSNYRTFSSPEKRNPASSAVLLSPQSLSPCPPLSHFLSMCSPVLGISCTRNHIIWLWCLSMFSRLIHIIVCINTLFSYRLFFWTDIFLNKYFKEIKCWMKQSRSFKCVGFHKTNHIWNLYCSRKFKKFL